MGRVQSDADVYDNLIYDNRNWGIFWELSYGGTRIHHNTLRGNGVGDGTANWGANVQLVVSNSDGSVGDGIEIYRNSIDGRAYAIGLLHHSSGTPLTRQVFVHHNRVTIRSEFARIGASIFGGRAEIFSSTANNRFNHNMYRVPDRRLPYWEWDGQTLTWREWRAIGQDTDGSLRIIV